MSREESWVTARMRARKPTSGTTGRGMPTTRASVHPATAATEQRTEAPSHHQPSSVGCSPSAVRIVASRPRSVKLHTPTPIREPRATCGQSVVRSSPARATTTRQPAPPGSPHPGWGPDSVGCGARCRRPAGPPRLKRPGGAPQQGLGILRGQRAENRDEQAVLGREPGAWRDRPGRGGWHDGQCVEGRLGAGLVER